MMCRVGSVSTSAMANPSAHVKIELCGMSVGDAFQPERISALLEHTIKTSILSSVVLRGDPANGRDDPTSFWPGSETGEFNADGL